MRAQSAQTLLFTLPVPAPRARAHRSSRHSRHTSRHVVLVRARAGPGGASTARLPLPDVDGLRRDSTAAGATGLDSSKDGSPPHGFFGPPAFSANPAARARARANQSDFLIFSRASVLLAPWPLPLWLRLLLHRWKLRCRHRHQSTRLSPNPTGV
eukprot:COSAG03_NODE_1270_length_4382_cov_7.711347_4_plen_155_part_00